MIMKERLIGALAGEVEMEEIQIEVEGGEFARWVMETGQEELPRKKTNVLHRRNRISAEKNIKEWDGRLGYEIGTKEEISKLQLEDKTLDEVRQRAIKRNKGDVWMIEEEVLYKVRKNKRGGKAIQLVVPKEKRKEVMEREHDAKTAGHMGIFKTMERIAAKYWWPEMRRDVEELRRHPLERKQGQR